MPLCVCVGGVALVLLLQLGSARLLLSPLGRQAEYVGVWAVITTEVAACRAPSEPFGGE